ncbi:MAG TPA: sigma 54-interacting transcriptional regulator [Terriglobales bacterium]
MQEAPGANLESEAGLRQHQLLLEMADLLVCHDDIRGLLCDLAGRLRQLVLFDSLIIAEHDPGRNTMRVHAVEGQELVPLVAELSVQDSISGWVWTHQEALVLREEDVNSRFPRIAQFARERNIRSACVLPLTRGPRRLGALSFVSRRRDAYHDADVCLLRRVGELVSLAASNALDRNALATEKARLQALLEINAALVKNFDVTRSVPSISEFIRKVVDHDLALLLLYDEPRQVLRYVAGSCNGPGGHDQLGGVPLRASASGQAFLAREPRAFSRDQMALAEIAPEMAAKDVRRLCCLPLIAPRGPVGILNLVSCDDHAFPAQTFGFLKQIASQMAAALDNARAYGEIAQLKDRLAEEKLYFQEEIYNELNFEEIVGESTVLKRALSEAKTVAESDATVLILGETGTGKELVARAIHRMSARKDASFIKLNCAAIPTGLLESELFGHEKGAFTGAISQKIGRLELADRGSLFLDEIGDIPLELQPKLLRVLQDQEFERLGSTRTQRVNIRLIAATNRDLAQSVSAKEFRQDLFYRLHVFPIHMPALRERADNIPMLVRCFVQKFARRMNKQIESIPAETMKLLVEWEWPGNVRELENFIERSVILTRGPALQAPLAELKSQSPNGRQSGTLENLQRDHILRVLQETRGVIAGSSGAAARLGLKRTTLQSMIQRMGISRQDFHH